MTGLVMVSAGITLANVLFPKNRSDATAALPGFLINVGFGTFVEAAYPFMFASKLVFEVRGTEYTEEKTEIVLGYSRPWEKDTPPAQMFNVKIIADRGSAAKVYLVRKGKNRLEQIKQLELSRYIPSDDEIPLI